MIIRKMKLSDYETVYALWLSCKGMGLNDIDDSRNGVERFLNRNPETCFAAEINDKLVGVIMAGNDGRRGYIYHTAVHPDFRNQGIARTLVETVMKALKECGINKVALVVFERNQGGNDFWEKLGFTVRNDLVYRNRSIVEMVRIDT
ncbi:MAG: GNAT family N-acetyltransferase [Ruminococcus sp.]|nr:GNAT family N-acetyltransferase [Ruminococcus sp.]